MRQLKQWCVAGAGGLVAIVVADLLLDILGNEPVLATGLAVGTGVAVTTLAWHWLERRRQARELLAKFNEHDPS
jgi:hypothetical protein